MSFQSFFTATPEKPVFSFEFFPPKSDEGMVEAKRVIAQFCELKPEFVTVTYGAGGGTRERTRLLTSFIANELSTPAVAHLTCMGHSRNEIDAILAEYLQSGVSHILALRGDPPKGATSFETHPEGFSCARDLAEHIAEKGSFSIAVAAYPEGHPEAASQDTEMKYLKDKVNAGAELVITQLFFDVEHYRAFVRSARAAGITAPIMPGIMPIGNLKQVKRFTSMCGATVPTEILEQLEALGDDPVRVKDYGVQIAVKLCKDLLADGAPGIHFYTLNKSEQVERIYKQLTEG